MKIYNYKQELIKLQNEWEKKYKDNKIFENNFDFSELIEIDEELFFPSRIDDIYSLGTITDKEIVNVSNEVCENDFKCLQPNNEVNNINSVTKKEIVNVAKQDPENSICVLDSKPYLQLIDNLLMDEENTEKNVQHDHNYKKKPLKSSENTAVDWKKKLPLSVDLYKIETVGSLNVFKCNLCPKIYTRKNTLKIHISNIHTGMMYEVCKFCNKKYKISYIKKHIKTHTQKILFCEYCEKSFVNNESFIRHVRSHNMNLKKYKCELCGMKSFYKYLMTRHMQLHEKKITYFH